MDGPSSVWPVGLIIPVLVEVGVAPSEVSTVPVELGVVQEGASVEPVVVHGDDSNLETTVDEEAEGGLSDEDVWFGSSSIDLTAQRSRRRPRCVQDLFAPYDLTITSAGSLRFPT